MPPNAAASARQAASMVNLLNRGGEALSAGGSGAVSSCSSGPGAPSLGEVLSSAISGALCGVSMLASSIFGVEMIVVSDCAASMGEDSIFAVAMDITLALAKAILGVTSTPLPDTVSASPAGVGLSLML